MVKTMSFAQEILTSHANLIRMATRRQDLIRKRLIPLFEKKKLNTTELDLAQYYLSEYDKAQKFTRKMLSSGTQRLDYLTKLYKEETAASKRRVEEREKQKASAGASSSSSSSALV